MGRVLSTNEAAELLTQGREPIIEETILNWLEGGYFPGSYQDDTGQWSTEPGEAEEPILNQILSDRS